MRKSEGYSNLFSPKMCLDAIEKCIKFQVNQNLFGGANFVLFPKVSIVMVVVGSSMYGSCGMHTCVLGRGSYWIFVGAGEEGIVWRNWVGYSVGGPRAVPIGLFKWWVGRGVGRRAEASPGYSSSALCSCHITLTDK